MDWSCWGARVKLGSSMAPVRDSPSETFHRKSFTETEYNCHVGIFRQFVWEICTAGFQLFLLKREICFSYKVIPALIKLWIMGWAEPIDE